MSFERTIAHLDMDAFYASVELRRRPELKGKPVVVCGSGPRAVVTTASYEARKLAGIHSAMPAAVARRRLPDAVYLRPDFPAYREASAQVMEVLRRNAETVEVVGLDEAYLDLTGLFSPKATMRRIATEIRERDRADLLGRDLREPDAGQDHQRAGQAGRARRALARARRWSASPTDSPGLVPGIGPKTVARLEAMGIRTLADLRGRRRGRRSKPPSARARAPGCTPAASSSDETPIDARARDQVAVGRDHLRRRRRRARPSWSATWPSSPRSSAAACASASSRAARSGSRSGSTTGPTSPARTRSRSRPTTPAVVGPSPCELLRAYDPQRPVRLLGVRVASFESDDAAAEAGARQPGQLQLGLAG